MVSELIFEIGMATVDQLVEALCLLADQQGALQGCLVQIAQQQANMMSSGGGHSKDKHWNDIGPCKNVRLFAGDPRDLEEVAEI